MRIERNGKYIRICEFENSYSIGIIDKKYINTIEINGRKREIAAPGAGFSFVLLKDYSSFHQLFPKFDDDEKELSGKYIKELRKKEVEEMVNYLIEERELFSKFSDYKVFADEYFRLRVC